MTTIKLLKKEELLKITSFEDFSSYVKANKKTLNQLISKGLGFSAKKLELIPYEEMILFHFAIAKDFFVESLVNLEDPDSEFAFAYLNERPFFSLDFEFFKLISQTGASVRVESIKTSKIIEFTKAEDITYSSDQVFYAMSYLEDNKFYLSQYFVGLDDEEADGVYDVLLDNDETSEDHLFVDLIIIGRMIKGFLKNIDSLMAEYAGDLFSAFDQADILNFYNHFNGIAKYLFSSDDTTDLYQLNYYDFIKGQCQAGNFIIEGDLESFIEICLYLMDLASQDLGHEVKAIKYLRQAEENIFTLRQEIIKNHPLTDQETLYSVGRLVRNGSKDLGQFIKLSLLLETLSKWENLELTVNNKIKVKSLRAYIEEFLTDYEAFKEGDFEENKILVDLAIATLLSNDLVLVNQGQVFPTDRINFFLEEDPVAGLSNVIKGVFRKETLAYYLGKGEKTSQEIFTKTMEAIRTNNFFSFASDKNEEEVLKLLKTLEIIRERDHQGEVFYEYGDIGKLLQDQEEKKQKKAKVLNLADFRQK